MSLKNILLGLGRKVLGKKPAQSPATGKEQRLTTYEGKASQSTGKELVTQELKNPPVVLKKTKPLQMGDDVAPAFGSSTYDWAMKMGRGQYSADEWLNHLTSTRKIKFKVFNREAEKVVREPKKFKYDSGPFQGKEMTIQKEELFDSNIALFNEAGDLTGGLLYAAQKFGLKLNANDIGAMIKLNPVNRLKAVELGVPSGAKEAFEKSASSLSTQLKAFKVKYRNNDRLQGRLDAAEYEMNALERGQVSKGNLEGLTNAIKKMREDGLQPQELRLLNKQLGEVNAKAVPLRTSKTQYQGETNYTLQGGKDYRETIFRLDEPIQSNRNALKSPGHFSEAGTNQVYHLRYDTRFTPEGKKVFMINEIQSDVNQPVAKALSKVQQLSGESRTNPFQADIEMNLLSSNRAKLMKELDEAVTNRQPNKAQAISKEVREIQSKLDNVFQGRSDYGGNKFDYFPMVEADAYGDHALKYLMQKAARENVDYVAIAPFNKLSFRQGYKAGNERFYGYADGRGIDNKGKAVLPDLMKKTARFYNSQAGPTKISLSDPKLPYKQVGKDTFKFPDSHKMKGKKIESPYHDNAVKDPKAGYKLIPDGDPRLYFDAFAIKVTPLMRQTQKTYKSRGGLVVDIFKPIRYN
tara:strand:+ start:2 stop:1906 length:1905 start_codon:yes stop_codon:yes gene_type:complete